MTKTPDLIIYTDSSPNGFKITIALEELGLPYTLKHVHIEQGENRQPDFLQLNPHGRIPVLMDTATGITLFESAAILLYLAQKTARLLPEEPQAHWSSPG
ncbi:glutathione S-transferase N-terminal domain-containing protein [Pseudomonas sp. QTF5]|uniref:glutathione S-transferase N-terminal domain-containing protein n=1 Tax=Pseudomonas sp. QTF5 TaxID=1435425 RepID=UPI0004AF5B22|nr:glutathione S-transferase N-terminal domain-containing protein [Pseudomonas sp. QTF5]